MGLGTSQPYSSKLASVLRFRQIVWKVLQIRAAAWARSAARASRRAFSIHTTCGCTPPSTRRMVRPVSSSVVTLSRRSSNVAPGSSPRPEPGRPPAGSRTSSSTPSRARKTRRRGTLAYTGRTCAIAPSLALARRARQRPPPGSAGDEQLRVGSLSSGALRRSQSTHAQSDTDGTTRPWRK